ncbi:hypothetical protein LBMAG20_01430 [Methylocystaceae bacterium]|nr:hypothetical protein LBMAG20_01430 [Methylocystaceae bacterium]
MLAPMSMDEVTAERDLLRAEFAAREYRMEQDMEALKLSKAQDLAAVGRHAARVADSERLLREAADAHRDMQAQLREAQKIAAERTELLNSTELALHEMTLRTTQNLQRQRLSQGQENGAAGSAVAETEVAALREAIVDFGDRVAQLTQPEEKR